MDPKTQVVLLCLLVLVLIKIGSTALAYVLLFRDGKPRQKTQFLALFSAICIILFIILATIKELTQ